MKCPVEIAYALGAEHWVEFVYPSGATAEAIAALGMRDGLAGRFGRELLGITVHPPLEPLGPIFDHTGRRSEDRPSPALRPGEVAAAPEPEAWPVEVDRPWFRYEGAFGFGGQLGVQLRRCAAKDPSLAADAADEALAHLLHQRTVYPVAAEAIPVLVRLVGMPEVAPRARLAEGLGQLADEVKGRRPTVAAMARAVARVGAATSWLGDSLVGTYLRTVEAEAACRRALRDVGPALRALRDDPAVGPAIRRVA